MTHKDDEELRALMRELVECGKQNAKREGGKTSFKDAVGSTAQILGICVVLLGLVGFLMSMRADINANTATIATIQKERSENIKKLNEMWWMKEHGIGNRDTYIQEHGSAPPTKP